MTSQEAQQLLGQAQVYQQQVQGIMSQKELLNTQLMELEKAIEELDKTKEKEVYKISGPILLKTVKSEVKKDLKEKKEMINTRLKSLETSEKKVKEKIDVLRQKLSKGPSAG
jgi:prefoldin beta subunit